jgi:hypothetical protein
MLGATHAGGAGGVGVTNPERSGIAVPVSDQSDVSAVSRREVFLFAAVLAATALTGAAAVSGLKRSPPAPPALPQVGQTITPSAPAPVERVEPVG